MKVWLPFKTHKSKVFLIYPVNQCMKYLRFLNFIFFMVFFMFVRIYCQPHVRFMLSEEREAGLCRLWPTCLSLFVVSPAVTEILITQTEKNIETFLKRMNISNVTFETISFIYFFNFTDVEFFNLSSQEFQNFQPNLTDLGKFGLSFSCSHY